MSTRATNTHFIFLVSHTHYLALLMILNNHTGMVIHAEKLCGNSVLDSTSEFLFCAHSASVSVSLIWAVNSITHTFIYGFLSSCCI
jgi:hypothetical protein